VSAARAARVGTHLEDLLAVLGAVYAARNRKNRGGFASAWWPIKKEMWQAVLLNELLDRGGDVLVGDDVVESDWPVLFDPKDASDAASTRRRRQWHQGRLSLS
jgi:hypothetical protein